MRFSSTAQPPSSKLCYSASFVFLISLFAEWAEGPTFVRTSIAEEEVEHISHMSREAVWNSVVAVHFRYGETSWPWVEMTEAQQTHTGVTTQDIKNGFINQKVNLLDTPPSNNSRPAINHIYLFMFQHCCSPVSPVSFPSLLSCPGIFLILRRKSENNEGCFL